MATPNQSNGAPAATEDRSVELVNRLLKLPEEARLDLAYLLLDSVRQGFTSLGEAEKRDREMIRERVAEVVRGEATLLDVEDVLADLERRYGQENPS